MTLAAVTLCGCTDRPSAAPAAIGPCADARAWQDELRSLPAGALLNVDASYIRDTCSGTAQVAATKLLLRGTGASYSARLNRLLECSSGYVVVTGPGDSFLPAGQVEFDVEPAADNFAVTIRADSVAKNILLLRRAKVLARHQGTSGS